MKRIHLLIVYLALYMPVVLFGYEESSIALDIEPDHCEGAFQSGVGTSYYEDLIEKATRRKWAVQTSFHFATEDGAFDCDGCSVPLANHIFSSGCVTIADVYLFSRLSDCNKVRINNCDALACERGGVPVGGVGVPFGGFRDDLYTTLLAPVILDFAASEKEFDFLLSIVRRFEVGSYNNKAVNLGFQLPLVHKKHSLDLNFLNGELFRVGFIPDTTQRETSLRQFFRDYSSLTDFINRAVLCDKGISFEAEQSKTGLGDVVLYGSYEYCCDHVFEAGFSIVFPTSGTGCGTTLWEPVLGNGGAYQFNPFAQVLLHSSMPYLNPFVRLAAEFSSRFNTDSVRAPTLVTNDMRKMVHEVEGLCAPESFENFYVDPFSEFDSCVPLFAGKTPCISKRIGSKILFGLGNYAYNVFNVDLRWGFFYDFYYKGSDSFCVREKCSCDCKCEPDVIDTCALENCTDERSHTIGTNLTYKFSNLFELGAGGTFTVLGKNVPRSRSLYFSFVAVF